LRRYGTSTALIVVIVLVIVAVAAVGYYLGTRPAATSTSSTKSSTTTTVTTTTSTSTNQTTSLETNTNSTAAIQAQIQAFEQDFANRNPAELVTLYTSDAVETWTGNAGAEAGVATGTANIQLLYDATIGKTTSVTVTYSNVTYNVLSASLINTTDSILIAGHSTVLGNFNSTIDGEQQWTNQGGKWLIQSEVWNYLSLKAQNHVGATVFPQWGLELSGNPPSLSQEHVLEWNLAPYLAGIIYASIGILAVYGLWWGVRKPKK